MFIFCFMYLYTLISSIYGLQIGMFVPSPRSVRSLSIVVVRT